MGLLIPLFGIVYGTDGKGRATAASSPVHRTFVRRVVSAVPFFILGFLVFVLIRTLGDITAGSSGAAFGFIQEERWVSIHGAVKKAAVYLLVFALAGVGLRTRFRNFRELGFKPFLVGLAAAVAVGIISYGLITLLGSFVAIRA